MSGLPDYHTHTSRCGHARGSAAEYVQAARERGLTGIGICDHLPFAGPRDPELSMDVSEIADYVGEVQELKDAYPGFVFLGIEADYQPDSFEATRELLGMRIRSTTSSDRSISSTVGLSTTLAVGRAGQTATLPRSTSATSSWWRKPRRPEHSPYSATSIW